MSTYSSYSHKLISKEFFEKELKSSKGLKIKKNNFPITIITIMNYLDDELTKSISDNKTKDAKLLSNLRHFMRFNVIKNKKSNILNMNKNLLDILTDNKKKNNSLL